ncbi:hypothetical protein M407DRAFT_33120 [Tulasnella calospora MUT 4182]|uniref:Uncharacterized protein n=1 Tax=Tulasnella calospora MUT 4182 TaxID=1051891 RepID=A0A0C3Q3L5_9AGAM|nr:hypothetical protein M407DRAFT_33120 [Tulasnella calospora MUT 4182]
MSDTLITDSKDTPASPVRPRHINDLPYDVFHLIFSICFQAPLAGVPFPVLASHVCRTWRQHALNTPNFWTKLEFHQKKPQFEQYRVWLERANGSPFDVFIDQKPFQKASLKHAKEIMRLIMPNIASLRTLEVARVPQKVLCVIFDRLTWVSAPQLRKLAVKAERNTAWYGEGKPSKWKFKPFIEGEAPSLQELNLSGINPTHTISRFKNLKFVRLKWSGVFGGPNSTSYDHAKSVQDLLTTLPNLEYLLVNDGRYHDIWPHVHESQQLPAHPPPITHKNLIHASIGASPSNVSAIVASLVVPKLRYAIDRQQNELAVGVSCLGAIARSNPCPFSSLVSLRLAGGYGTASMIVHPENSTNMGCLEGALARLKRLKSLTLDQVNFEDDQYLPCLERTCPKLQWLRLVLCQRYTMKQVRSIVEARLAANKKLRPLVRLIVHQWAYEAPIPFEHSDREWLEGAVQFDVKKYPLESTSGQDYLSVVKGIRSLTYM